MMQKPLYLDSQSTTPIDPRVLEAMRPFLGEEFGNAASRTHAYGKRAAEAAEQARSQVAQLIGVTARELVFTSGATESINLAIKGVVEAQRAKGDHVVTIATEHKAVLDSCARLERERSEHRESLRRAMGDPDEAERIAQTYRRGASVTWLGVSRDGRVDAAAIDSVLRPETVLVSVMHANNEIGVLQPIREIAELCRHRGVIFHVDAAQGLTTESLDARGMDLVSLSAHKLYGPKGVGALYVRDRQLLVGQIDGGGHERGLRSGTLNVAALVGFGAAAELARTEREGERARLLSLRSRLLEKLRAAIPRLEVHGSLDHRLPGNLSVSFVHVDAKVLLAQLPELALSTGSACTSSSLEPSHVLRALAVPNDLARSAVRIGLGRFTTEADVDFAARRISEEVARLRAQNPAWG